MTKRPTPPLRDICERGGSCGCGCNVCKVAVRRSDHCGEHVSDCHMECPH